MVSVAKIAIAAATWAGSSSGATFASFRASVSLRATSRAAAGLTRFDPAVFFATGTVHPLWRQVRTRPCLAEFLRRGRTVPLLTGLSARFIRHTPERL